VRIVVVGISGAGKTTMANEIASKLALPLSELDALYWRAGWQRDLDDFSRRVEGAISAETWVIDGNYNVVRRSIWMRATHLVWLDYGLAVVMYRVILRSIIRNIRQEKLWDGNKDTWRLWFRADHPIRRAWRNWGLLRREIDEMLRSSEYAHLVVLRLRRPREASNAIDKLMDLSKQR